LALIKKCVVTEKNEVYVAMLRSLFMLTSPSKTGLLTQGKQMRCLFGKPCW